MVRCDSEVAIIALVAAVLVPGLASAQATRRIGVEVMISHISPNWPAGSISPRAAT